MADMFGITWKKSPHHPGMARNNRELWARKSRMSQGAKNYFYKTNDREQRRIIKRGYVRSAYVKATNSRIYY